MLMYSTNEEKEISSLLRRGMRGEVRGDRYISLSSKKEVSMNTILKQFIDTFVRNQKPDEYVRKYIVECINRLKKFDKQNDFIEGGILAKYHERYIIVFPRIRNLDLCALKVTHSDKEDKLLMEFFANVDPKVKELFIEVCYQIAEDKQQRRVLRDLPTSGVIYSNYPEEDIVISDGFVEYITTNHKEISTDSNLVINELLSRKVSYEEIDSIIPEDVESRFLVRDFDEYEIAQLEILYPNISAQA